MVAMSASSDAGSASKLHEEGGGRDRRGDREPQKPDSVPTAPPAEKRGGLGVRRRKAACCKGRMMGEAFTAKNRVIEVARGWREIAPATMKPMESGDARWVG